MRCHNDRIPMIRIWKMSIAYSIHELSIAIYNNNNNNNKRQQATIITITIFHLIFLISFCQFWLSMVPLHANDVFSWRILFHVKSNFIFFFLFHRIRTFMKFIFVFSVTLGRWWSVFRFHLSCKRSARTWYSMRVIPT